MATDDNWNGPYGVVIYTNKYAGNFERQLCAYITGTIGYCEVGKEYAKIYDEECPSDPFGDFIDLVGDDHGCFRPVSIWNDSYCQETYSALIIYFSYAPTKELIDIIRERAEKYNSVAGKYDKQEGLEILDIKVFERKVTVVDTEIEVL